MHTKLQWDEDWVIGDGELWVIFGYHNGESLYEIYDNTQNPAATEKKFKLYCQDAWEELCEIKEFPESYPTLQAAETAAQEHFTKEMARQRERGVDRE